MIDNRLCTYVDSIFADSTTINVKVDAYSIHISDRVVILTISSHKIIVKSSVREVSFKWSIEIHFLSFVVLCSAGEPLKDSSGERNMECSPTGSGSTTCPSTHSCESTSGSTGFGGVCCPRPQYVCKLTREQGNCGTYSNRWWFNAKTGNCEEFIYSGCQGNANNFESYKECQDYCRDARSMFVIGFLIIVLISRRTSMHSGYGAHRFEQ